MKNDIVGLIYTGENIDALRDLIKVRSVAALPMLGRYRLIDFMLSNMIHSDMHNVGIIMQKNYHSLIDHLGSGREWDLHGKRSGMTILPPYMSRENVGIYEGLLDALHSNLSFLRRSRERYVIVTDSYILYSISFEKMLAAHLRMSADITLLYTKERSARRNSWGRYLDVEEDGTVRHLEHNPIIPHYENTYMSAFLIRREMLVDIVDRAVASGQHHFTRELIVQMLREKLYRICGYECPGDTWCIDSVQAYYDANMDFLDADNRSQIFRPERPVWTKLRDEMPAQYIGDAGTVNSLVADGCVIEGNVENSILFRGVVVRKGASVRNSIVMQDTVIHRNAEVACCILDKDTTVREGTRIAGSISYPFVVSKGLAV